MSTRTRAPKIEALFAPHRVVAFTSHVSADLVGQLWAEEQPATAPMAETRLVEFATARACARAALGELGIEAGVPKSGGGAPLWPVGATGSISHTRGFCVAVATTERCNVGIDIEEVGRMKPAIERRILVDVERSDLDNLASGPRRKRLATIFAAKEAFYKAHYELEPRYLGFDAIAVQVGDAEVRFQPSSGEVTQATLLTASGAFCFEDGRVIVGVTIDQSGHEPPIPSAA